MLNVPPRGENKAIVANCDLVTLRGDIAAKTFAMRTAPERKEPFAPGGGPPSLAAGGDDVRGVSTTEVLRRLGAAGGGISSPVKFSTA